MVVGDGTILTANDNENPDLFWAVRGGGCNFGVCTQFVLKLHDQRKTVYSGVLIFPPPLLEQLFKVVKEWWDGNPTEKSAMFMVFAKGPPPERLVGFHFPEVARYANFDYSAQPCAVVIPFYNGSEEEGREAFKFLLDLSMCVLLLAAKLTFGVDQNLWIIQKRCHLSSLIHSRYAHDLEAPPNTYD